MAFSRTTVVSSVHCAHFLGTWLPSEDGIRPVEDANQSSLHLYLCKSSSDLVPMAQFCHIYIARERMLALLFHASERTDLQSDAFAVRSSINPQSSPALWSQGNFPLCCQQARRPDISGLQVPAAPHGTLALSFVASENQSMLEYTWNISKPVVATCCKLKSVGRTFVDVWGMRLIPVLWVWLPCAPSCFQRGPFDPWCVI